MKIYVGNFVYSTSESELRKIFSRYGKVVSANIFIDCYTRQRREFGFVKMSSRREGLSAIAKLDGKTVNNRILTVKEIVI